VIWSLISKVGRADVFAVLAEASDSSTAVTQVDVARMVIAATAGGGLFKVWTVWRRTPAEVAQLEAETMQVGTETATSAMRAVIDESLRIIGELRDQIDRLRVQQASDSEQQRQRYDVAFAELREKCAAENAAQNARIDELTSAFAKIQVENANLRSEIVMLRSRVPS
jgi:hypothetical protein